MTFHSRSPKRNYCVTETLKLFGFAQFPDFRFYRRRDLWCWCWSWWRLHDYPNEACVRYYQYYYNGPKMFLKRG